jgi:uncharacterized protein
MMWSWLLACGARVPAEPLQVAQARAALAASPPALDRAAELYQAACDAGYMPSCSALALQLQDGRGVAHDPNGARTLHQRACDGGAGIGCFNLGLMLQSGAWTEPDPDAATALFVKADALYAAACDAGDLQWCMNRGVLHEDGYGVPKDPAKALSIYRAACDAGHGDSCVNLALMQLYGDAGPADPAAARTLLRATCDKDVPLACGVLGQQLFREGDGVAAVPLLEGACEAGQRDPCGVLGAIFGMGELVPPDPARASALEERACALGSSLACKVEASASGDRPARAAEFYRKGCWIGDGEACGMLGAHFELGRGVSADVEAAIEMYRAGCRMTDPGSCVTLLQKGLPLPLPPELDQRMRQAACANGVAEACP